jgi:hypothetical protein
VTARAAIALGGTGTRADSVAVAPAVGNGRETGGTATAARA